ncbi:glycerophosphodiester phosphodiesterase [Luteococcus sp. Sow4_B9]|uniref:glycerophosphodiester phosphodiesterase n=1 Tax=Luteococcus sp. Sow4_B9 TaxID=3438792 RepID=UPI003F961262
MTKVWAHRGASAVAPENTMSAFRKAIELGADGIEIDVQRAADGTIVVIHDETLDRTTNGTGRIVETRWEDMAGLDASAGDPAFAGEPLPRLTDVLELLAPTQLVLNIELKDGNEPYPGMDAQVAELVRAAGMTDRVVLSSFNHVQFAGSAELGLPRGLLYVEPLWAAEKYAAAFGAQAVHPDFRTLAEPGLLERFRAEGIAVHVWTVNEREHLEQVFRLGVDAVITDEVELALQVRAELA